MKRLFNFTLLFILILTFNLYSNVRISGTMNRNLRILYIYNLRDIASFQYPLFTLTINNDADTTAYCHLMITLSSNRFGEITYLSTNQFPMNPHEIWSLQNNTITNNPKQIVLSNFEINPNIEGLINETLSQGKLPEDIYYIRVEVLDSYNNVLSMWSDQFTIINSITITSIFPGTIYKNLTIFIYMNILHQSFPDLILEPIQYLKQKIFLQDLCTILKPLRHLNQVKCMYGRLQGIS
jgi:hypothetical protein